jgi:hypothetical protein
VLWPPEQTTYLWGKWKEAIEKDDLDGIDMMALGYSLPIIPVRDAVLSYAARHLERREQIVKILAIVNKDILESAHPVADTIVCCIALMNGFNDIAAQLLYHIRTTFQDSPYQLAELMVTGLLGDFAPEVYEQALGKCEPDLLADQSIGEEDVVRSEG